MELPVKKKILYIAGYSRSGSTILDIILSSHPQIFGTGELGYLFDDWIAGTRLCTCEQKHANCVFWKNLKLPDGINFKEAQQIVRQIETRKNLKFLVSNKFHHEIVEKYRLIQTALYNYIFETSGKEIIVDSSKSSRDMAGRFYALHTFTNFDVYVIHLVKNGLRIIESYVKKGRNWAIEGYVKNDHFLAARSSVGWLLANKIAYDLGEKLPKGKYLQLRYEDLIYDPPKILNKIGEFINENLAEVINNVKESKSFTAKHNVGGNRLRLEKEIKFNPSIDNEKKISLSFKDRLTFKLIAGKLNRRFGYN
jgi:hypothetical protein